MCKTTVFIKEARDVIQKIDSLLKSDISEDYVEFQSYMAEAEELIESCHNPSLPTLDRLIDKVVETGWCDREELKQLNAGV